MKKQKEDGPSPRGARKAQLELSKQSVDMLEGMGAVLKDGMAYEQGFSTSSD